MLGKRVVQSQIAVVVPDDAAKLSALAERISPTFVLYTDPQRAGIPDEVYRAVPIALYVDSSFRIEKALPIEEVLRRLENAK